MDKTLIIITVNPADPTVRTDLMSVVIPWLNQGAKLHFANHFMVDNARNEGVRKFLKSDCDKLLFLDADMIPYPGILPKMLEADKDILGVSYKAIRENQFDIETNEYHSVASQTCIAGIHTLKDGSFAFDSVESRQGLVKVSGVGTGCMLIKRKVFEAMPEPWFYFKWDEKHEHYIGEDYQFCFDAEKAGFEVWCETDLICAHAKTLLI